MYNRFARGICAEFDMNVSETWFWIVVWIIFSDGTDSRIIQNRWNRDSGPESDGITELESESENLGADFWNRRFQNQTILESDSNISAEMGKAGCDDAARQRWRRDPRCRTFIPTHLLQKYHGRESSPRASGGAWGAWLSAWLTAVLSARLSAGSMA